MTRRFDWQPSSLKGYRSDDTLFFDSDAFPVAYVPEANVISLSSQVISFPNFNLGVAYCWNIWDGGGGSTNESCISLTTIPRQNWGPLTMTPTPDNDLPETVVGVVPASCDHIRVQVRLTRTNAPDQINGNTIPVSFKEGEWVDCVGGSILVEALTPIVRLLTFYLAANDNGDGTRNVIMRRQQTANYKVHGFYSTSDYTNPGWIATSGGNTGTPVAQIQTRGPTNDPTGLLLRYRSDKATGCSKTPTQDYASDYTGDIKIIAGAANIDLTFEGADPNGAYAIYLGTIATDSYTARTTFNTWKTSDWSLADEHPTRHIVFGIAWLASVTTACSIVSVTFNGVVCNPIVATQSAGGGGGGARREGAEFWECTLPAGTVGTSLEIVFSSNVRTVSVDFWATYNVSSYVPYDYVATSDFNVDHNLTTPGNQGFVLGIGMNPKDYTTISAGALDPTLWMIYGIDNPQYRGGGYTVEYTVSRAFQSSAGETLVVRNNYNYGAVTGGAAPIFDWIALSMH